MSSPDRYTCEEALRRLDDFLDRELRPEEMQRVRNHLETCAVCAREFGFEAAVVQQVRSKLRRIGVPQELRTRLAGMLETERERRRSGDAWNTT